MKTDLLEYSRGDASALDKVFTNTNYAAGAEYYNDNTKWFYADFPMMFDPCTCQYRSKLSIVSELISTSQVALEGKVTGDIYTKDVGGKAQVQQPGSFGWKDVAGFVNGKYSNTFSSIDNFLSTSQQFASNLSNTSDTATKMDGLRRLANGLKGYNFLKQGFGSVPWLKAAVSLVDLFIGGGKQQTTGPAEVKLLPLAVNLTAKLNGTISLATQYHNIIFTNPGSKDAALDPGNYPNYNEVLGIFNLLQTPEVRYEREVQPLNDPYLYPWTNSTQRVNVDRFRFDTGSFKYILNPAANVTIQNMRLALIVEGEYYPSYYQGNNAISGHAMNPDFVYKAKDAVSNQLKFRTDYLDAKCFAQRVFKAISPYSTSEPNSNQYWGLWSAYRPKGIIARDTTVYLKIMLNLKRKDTTATTQNILYVVTYPVNLLPSVYLKYSPNNTNCSDTTLIQPASSTEINTFCSSSKYVNYNTRFSMRYRDSVANAEKLETDASAEVTRMVVSPNPNNGQFKLVIKPQESSLLGIKVIDMTGRTIYTSNEGRKDLRHGYLHTIALYLRKGTYIVMANTTDKVLKAKFTVITP